MKHHTRTFTLKMTSLLITALSVLQGACASGEPSIRGDGSTGSTTHDDSAPTSTAPPSPTSTNGETTASSTTADASTTDGTDETTAAPDDCLVKRSQVQTILGSYCSGCHSGPNAQIYDYVEDLDLLLTEGKIKAGDPDGSPLFQKIETDLMPPGDPKLTAGEKQSVYEWIGQCTGPVDQPACPDQPFISNDEMIDRMLTALGDLDQVDVDDQPFTRFFTLTHLHNAGICGTDLDLYRHALAKLLNGLSRNNDIKKPRALAASLDPGQTIYMIDLRDYGWEGQGGTPQDVWELLVERNPFAVQYTQKNALQVRTLTKTAVPFQMADWFITDASSAPLYDEILYERVFPVTGDITTMTRFDLETVLGIDAAAAVQAEIDGKTDEVIRGGFVDSGVSNQYRIIERHPSPLIAKHSYWLSHDFLSNIDLGNIFEHPLDFVADGGEIIWTLPNGLQGYLLVDGAGKRVDVASIDIVHNEEQGGEAIVNGTSCMGCHYQGMRLAVDEVGPYVKASVGEFTELQKQQVESLYPPDPDLADAIDADIASFIDSLKETDAPLLLGGIEVTQGVHNAFEDQPITLEQAAAELGLLPEALGKLLTKLPGLKSLENGSVSRDIMRAEFAAAICTLKQGVTTACP